MRQNERWKGIKIFSLGFHGNMTRFFLRFSIYLTFNDQKIANNIFHNHEFGLRRLQLFVITSNYQNLNWNKIFPYFFENQIMTLFFNVTLNVESKYALRHKKSN